MAIRNALIAVDFDGTVVTHAYPEIGDDAGAVPVLKELTDNGCRLILYTMRHGKLLDDAIRWFRTAGRSRPKSMRTSTSTTAASAARSGSWTV